MMNEIHSSFKLLVCV